MLTGLSAFPLTPFRDDAVDEIAFARLIQRLVAAQVDSITALGSTGSYMYLDRAERCRVATVAVQNAGTTPVFVGIGALRTSHVLAHAEDAQEAGASALLLAPVTYQPLTDDEVFGLFEDIAASVSVPVIVYDNPGTTRVTFSDDLYASISRLPHVASIKIPGVSTDPATAAARVREIHDRIDQGVTVGVSGDASAAAGLNAGCDAWYSVVGGTLPGTAMELTRAAQAGRQEEAVRLSNRLQPLWDLFKKHGSYRVVAALAEELDLIAPDSLPLPVRGIDASARAQLTKLVAALHLNFT
ncbi:dihydrodipicolinate synthase family protein [Plantibacter sp. M259]|uniref:dihydrodipicolinate synthase family protein n=1 Tax=Plantibacter sp. M259 TaxID=2583822 RepID=UPI001110ED6A|nr:dihydrodipicolinate synthase family protein [Plantibacter sp. M259]